MSQKGELASINFGKLLQWIYENKLSGTLRITNNNSSKYIFFNKGEINSTYSEFPEDSFRSVIRRMHLLPAFQQLELEFEQSLSDSRFVKKLIEKGYLTEREFLEVLRQQNIDILLSLFEWNEGEFEFFKDKFPDKKMVSLKIPVLGIIEKGLERMSRRKKLELSVAVQSLYKLSEDTTLLENIKQHISEDHKQVLSILENPRTLRDIVEETGLTEFRVLTIIKFLIDEKAVTVCDDTSIPSVPAHVREQMAAAEIAFSKKRYWEAWTKIRNVLKEYPNVPEIQKAFRTYSKYFKDDLKATISTLDQIPEILKSIDGKMYSKFPKDSALGFLLSRIDGKMTIKDLAHLLQIDREKLLVTLYLLIKAGVVALRDRRRGADPEEVAQRRIYARKVWEKMQSQNYYEILGVSKDTDEIGIKTAYFKLAKKYHPDARPQDEPNDVKEKFDRIFMRIRDAYLTLSDTGKRKAYDHKLSVQEMGGDLDALKSRTKAQLQYAIGIRALQSREYRTAMEYFRSAIDLDPYESSYYVKLAEVCTKNPRWYRAGILACRKALQLSPGETHYRAVLGMLHRLDGNLVEAEKQFRKVLESDPENRTARKELTEMGFKVPEIEKLKQTDTQHAPMLRKHPKKKS